MHGLRQFVSIHFIRIGLIAFTRRIYFDKTSKAVDIHFEILYSTRLWYQSKSLICFFSDKKSFNLGQKITYICLVYIRQVATPIADALNAYCYWSDLESRKKRLVVCNRFLAGNSTHGVQQSYVKWPSIAVENKQSSAGHANQPASPFTLCQVKVTRGEKIAISFWTWLMCIS